MKFFIIFLLLVPFASGMEIFQADSFVIVKNNLNSTINYNVISKDNSDRFYLLPNETKSLDIGNYEIQEDLGTNLISSEYIGSRDKDKYSDLKVILIGIFLALIVFIINLVYREFVGKRSCQHGQ